MYVMEHYVQRPVVKACMCAKWFPSITQGRNRFKGNTDSNFYQILDNGLVMACEPFAPHIHKGKRRKRS